MLLGEVALFYTYLGSTPSTPQNSQPSLLPAQQLRPQNIPYDDDEEKAKAIHTEMKKVNLSPEAMLKIAMTKFNSTNVRSLSWEQIDRLKIYIQSETKKTTAPTH